MPWQCKMKIEQDPLRSPSDKKYDLKWNLTKRLNMKYGHTYD